jgi:hypothetical protein
MVGCDALALSFVLAGVTVSVWDCGVMKQQLRSF